MASSLTEIELAVSPRVSSEALNTLFAAAWETHRPSEWAGILKRSLAYICAYRNGDLVGFVNIAWDGGAHAFLLDTTMHPALQRRGLGRQLVTRAAEVARARGITWLHVDYEPHLKPFYEACGFKPTQAGLLRLS